MAGAPVYIANEQGATGVRIGLEPTPVPSFPRNEIGPAVSELGQAGETFAEKMQVAKTAATATNALSTYLTGLDAAKTLATKDPDWQNAHSKFKDRETELRNDALADKTLDPRTAAVLNLHMTHASISAGDQVQKAALSKGADGWLADYESQAQYNQNDAATAGSPVARQTAIDRNTALIHTGVNAQWISQAKAVELDQRFRNGLDHAEALRLVASDPKNAGALIADPNRFPSLTPVQRQTYVDTANQKADTDATQRARGIVAGSPETASLVAGQFVDSSHIDRVFNARVIPAESEGRNAPPNDKGAFGPAQITPAFARDYIAKLPADERAQIGDVSKLTDKELTDKLMAFPKISTEIGRIGFHALVEKYGGNPVLALAAYNAGPVNADRWLAAAQKQFGDNPSPQQIASVIDFKETRDYITKIYGAAGARMDAFGVSPAGRYHLGITLGTELTEQANREQHVLNQIASVSAATDDVPKLVEKGIDVAPDRIASFRLAQQQAAAGGNVEAARRLHELDFALAVKPQVDRLYRLPFSTVDALVDASEAAQKLPGANPSQDEVKGLTMLKTTRDEINKARIENPTGLMVRAGLSPYVPVDTNADPADPKFRAALTARGGQAVQAAQLYGGTTKALTPDEAESLKVRYAAASAQDQFKILKSLADSLPEAAYRDTVKTVIGDDASALIIGRFARERPELAAQMLDGAQLMKSKDVEENQKTIRPMIAEQIKGQLYPTAEQQGAVINAALYLDVARRNKRGALYNADDTSGVKQAIEDVAGALTSRNGMQVAAPPGMRAGAFNGILDTLHQGDVDQMGGAFDRAGSPVSAAEISNHGVLRQTAPGSPRYWVGTRDDKARDGFQPYFTGGEVSSPLVFDMHQLLARSDLKRRGIIAAGAQDSLVPRQAPGRAAFATQDAEAQKKTEMNEPQLNALTDFWGRITGNSEPKMIQGDRSSGYPTAEDAEFARKYDFAYGKEWEPFFNNVTAKIIGERGGSKGGEFRPQSMEGRSLSEAIGGSAEAIDLTDPKHAEIKGQVQDLFARAALAVNRDPIASLGFAPSRTMIDVAMKHANLAGAYGPKEDAIYSNLTTQSNIVHESIHRGLEQLRRRSPEARDLLSKAPFDEEQLVRYVMATTMGNPEQGSGSIADRQRKGAMYQFDQSTTYVEAQRVLVRLREIAAEEIAKKRPGGPR